MCLNAMYVRGYCKFTYKIGKRETLRGLNFKKQLYIPLKTHHKKKIFKKVASKLV